jgi:hypothetical protein
LIKKQLPPLKVNVDVAPQEENFEEKFFSKGLGGVPFSRK